jgi:hypothetical protein
MDARETYPKEISELRSGRKLSFEEGKGEVVPTLN